MTKEKYLQINDNFRITVDPQCWILQMATRDKETGEITTWSQNNTYHATLEQLFRRLTELTIIDDWYDYEGIKKDLDQIKEFVKGLMENINQILELYKLRYGYKITQ